jgi:tetratricopeptide (TPR) repeat protein
MMSSNLSDPANPLLSTKLGAGPDRLDSWKEIASYLDREVRTVQNWEKREGLPVHRHFHTQLGTVFAFRSEIEAWGQRKAAEQQGTVSTQTVVDQDIRSGLIDRRVRIEVQPFHGLLDASADPAVGQRIGSEIVAALYRLDQSKVEIVELAPMGQARPDKGTVHALEADYQLVWDAKCGAEFNTVIASLIRCRTASVVWSRSFQLGSGAGGETPAQIADRIVQCLWLKVVFVPQSASSKLRMEKPGSREAYLKGRFFWNRRNADSMRKAIDWFRVAIAEDPAFALPYSGLADSLTLLSFYEIVSPAEAMPEARSAALKAIELDPNLAEAHASLADIHLHFDRDWEGADREYRSAIQCNPAYALGYHWYANLLAAKGQHEAAHIAIMQALDIDPVSLITQVWAGVTSHLAHRYDDAIGHYQSALELDPNFTWAHMYMAQTLEQKGRYSEALREFEMTIQLSGGSNCVTAMKAHALALAGDKASARNILQQLRGTPRNQCMPSYDIAATYAALGDGSQSVRWLKRACNERNMKLFKLRQDPRFDLLRHDSEFCEVLENIGLARYNAIEPG